MPSLPGDARRPSRHKQEGRRIRHRHRSRPQLLHRHPHQVRPEELRLPRPDEGLPDIPVRHAHRRRRASRRGGRRQEAHHRHYPGAHGRGRGQATARTHLHRRDLQPGGRQPLRRASHGDSQRAGHPLPRGGPPVSHHPPDHTPLRGRYHRQHGGGELPVRRQREHPPYGQHRARDPRRSQKHEQLPLRVQRLGVRGGTSAARRGRRRARRSGDPRLGG